MLFIKSSKDKVKGFKIIDLFNISQKSFAISFYFNPSLEIVRKVKKIEADETLHSNVHISFYEAVKKVLTCKISVLI